VSVAALAGETMQALVDGRVAATVPLSDRGFAYGDGLFETVRIHDGKPVWWDAHLERLQRGCGVLGLDMPARALLQHECALLFPPGSHGVLRLALTRGDGPRGYLAPGSAARRVLQRAALPLPLPVALRLGWARLRLAIQPRLAGI